MGGRECGLVDNLVDVPDCDAVKFPEVSGDVLRQERQRF